MAFWKPGGLSDCVTGIGYSRASQENIIHWQTIVGVVHCVLSSEEQQSNVYSVMLLSIRIAFLTLRPLFPHQGAMRPSSIHDQG